MRRAAALMFALAACGDSLSGPPDAPPPPDANPNALIRVRYTRSDVIEGEASPALAGHRVYFVTPNGSLALVTTTDSAGLASARMPDGGNIVVIDFTTGSMSVYLGARGGEEIPVGLGAPSSQAFIPSLSLTLTLAQHENLVRYLLHTSCDVPVGGVSFSTLFRNITDVSASLNAPTSPPPYQLFDCDNDSTQDLLITAVDFNNVPVAYRYLPALAFPSRSTSKDLGDDYAPALSHITVNNVAPRIANFTVSQELWDRHFLTSSDENSSAFLTPIDGSADTVFPLPTPASATLVTHVTEVSDVNPGIQNLLDWGPAGPETTIDFGGEAVTPRLTKPSIDSETFTVRWNDEPSAADDPARPDTVFVSIPANGNQNIFTINVLGPYTVDESGMATLALPRVSELVDAVFIGEGGEPQVTKLHLGAHPARTKLLQTGLSPFPFDGASGHVSFESTRPFF